MALTYTEIEQEKSARIWVFFLVVLVFYFLIAAILGNAAKVFFALSRESAGIIYPFLTKKEFLYILCFALAAAVIHAAYSVSNAIPLITRNLDGQSIDISDTYHERFKKIVDEVNVATGSKCKITPIVIPTVAMNAFAVSDSGRNAVIGVTEGLLSKLNRQQLEAVVAHECGHIVSGDSFQTTVGCALFGIYAAMLTAIGKIFRENRVRSSGKGSGGIILFLLFVYVALSIMQFFYNLIRLFISRDRELRADAIAVRLTRDPVSLSEALYSISRGWRGLGQIDRNLESLFIINPVKEPADEAEGFFADLFSTHPSVKKRMSILAAMAHTDIKNIQEDVIAGENLRNAARQDEEGGPAIGPSSFNCPKCGRALTDVKYEGTIVHKCGFCEGALVDNSRIPRIIIREERVFSERLKKIAELAHRDGLKRAQAEKEYKIKSYLKCPKCGSYMMKDYYAFGYAVETDRCDSCKNTWFDKDELEIAQYLIEKAHTKRSAKSDCSCPPEAGPPLAETARH